jgi:hypothetical protein
MEIVKIKASEFGLEEQKAKQIEEQFKPMLEKMTELEKEYNEILKLEINEETCKKAKELRLKYVKVRTGTAKIHEKQKAFYLAGGRFVDGWKNAQKFASEGIEESLMNIEKHFENLEKQRIADLQTKRAEELEKYEVEIIPDNLGEMSDDIWNNYITGTKLNYDQRKEAERKAEEERREQERKVKLYNERKNILIPFWSYLKKDHINIDFGELSEDSFNILLKEVKETKKETDIEQERIRKENERLKKEAEAKEKKRLAEEKERKAKEEKERQLREEQERKQQEMYEANLRKEREEREKIERELEKKRLAEEKARKEAEAKRQAELNKGDKEKVEDLIRDLRNIQSNYSFSSDANINMYENVKKEIESIINNLVFINV